MFVDSCVLNVVFLIGSIKLRALDESVIIVFVLNKQAHRSPDNDFSFGISTEPIRLLFALG